MSLVTKGIGAAKKINHRRDDAVTERTKVYISPARRIERVALNERVCAMTFDDGPCRMPARPDNYEGKPLTLVLAETLEKHGARGSFDVIGDTSENYPDEAGAEGSAAWGGTAYDHYPDFGCDSEGGVSHCPELVSRLLEGGHEITNHTWKHRLWGRKNVVYGKRRTMSSLEEVVEDLRIMDSALKEGWGFDIKLSRPPHYVDRIRGGFDSYDAYALMGYQYMAASFDGAGWLPLADYDSEVRAMIQPLEKALEDDPDALCGQIIFQKDGYNMARRSPVADGLEKQLEILDRYGYRVVSVSELMETSQFRDAESEAASCMAANGWCPAYRDNTLRMSNVLTRGELAMMAFGAEGAEKRIELIREKKSPADDVKYSHPYAGAVFLARSIIGTENGRFNPDADASPEDISRIIEKKTGKATAFAREKTTHGEFFDMVYGTLI